MKSTHRTFRFSVPAVALAAALAASPVLADHHMGETAHEKAFTALQRVEVNLLDIREQATRLRSYVRTPTLYSWEVHSDQLNRIAAETEDIATLLEEFKTMAAKATRRQQNAHSISLKHAVKLQDAAQTAIELLNEERNRIEELPPPEYREAVNTIYREANHMIEAIERIESRHELMNEAE